MEPVNTREGLKAVQVHQLKAPPIVLLPQRWPVARTERSDTPGLGTRPDMSLNVDAGHSTQLCCVARMSAATSGTSRQTRMSLTSHAGYSMQLRRVARTSAATSGMLTRTSLTLMRADSMQLARSPHERSDIRDAGRDPRALTLHAGDSMRPAVPPGLSLSDIRARLEQTCTSLTLYAGYLDAVRPRPCI